MKTNNESEQIVQGGLTSKPILNQRRNFAIIIGVIVFLLVIGGTAYFLTTLKKAEKLQNNKANPTQLNKTPTSTKVKIQNEPENFNAINGDVIFSYLYNPQDNERVILKQVDFKTNTSKDIVLPYLTESNRDENKRGKYKISPNGKYILKITYKKLEIADLSNQQNIVFKTIHTVPEMKSSVNIKDLDYASMEDAMWDDQNNLYFTTEVGADGVDNPFGVYTDLYVAYEDGTNKKLVNDHSIEDQKIGFMKSFAYIDTSKKEIYFSGMTHGGHLATMLVVDASSGRVKESLKDISTDIVKPVFNKDFSKAYYEDDLKEEGHASPVRIYEYDMSTKSKKLIYSVSNATEDYTSPRIENYPSGQLYLSQVQNKLYFQVRDGKTVHFYALDLTSGQQKLLLDDDGSCERKAISANGDYIFLMCRDAPKIIDYQLYQALSGKRYIFYKERYSDAYGAPSIQVVSLE